MPDLVFTNITLLAASEEFIHGIVSDVGSVQINNNDRDMQLAACDAGPHVM
jgi:hypothetical protein